MHKEDNIPLWSIRASLACVQFDRSLPAAQLKKKKLRAVVFVFGALK